MLSLKSEKKNMKKLHCFAKDCKFGKEPTKKLNSILRAQMLFYLLATYTQVSVSLW